VDRLDLLPVIMVRNIVSLSEAQAEINDDPRNHTKDHEIDWPPFQLRNSGAMWSNLLQEMANRERLFSALIGEVSNCVRCPDMCGRKAVLSRLNGSIQARVMFIGEAPGRKGADRTRIPFSGDQSGKNFDRFLESIGLTRNQIFITSAALCNPRTDSGANRKPTQKELLNCSDFLKRTFAIVQPDVVVTLGSVALDACKRICAHELVLGSAAAKIHSWHNRLLVPLYHPSPQVLASHRREAVQLQDYQVVARAIEQVR
jgi:uracil-DNA glycosylase